MRQAMGDKAGIPSITRDNKIEVIYSSPVVAVADNKINEPLNWIMSSLGLPLQFYTQADMALRFTQTASPIITLAAYRLPDTDGISFLSRAHREWPNSILILLRAKADCDWLDSCALQSCISMCIDCEDSFLPLQAHLFGLMGVSKLKDTDISITTDKNENTANQNSYM